MRKLKSLLLVAFLTLGMSGIVNAQKVGHVVYERVIANMPETRALQAELAKITIKYRNTLLNKHNKQRIQTSKELKKFR